MNRTAHPFDGLTREESCFLDGELPDETARLVEARLAADPMCSARLGAWHEAMAVWREDAAYAARGRGGPAVLVDRILAASGRPDAAGRAGRAPTGAGWYAAAAVLLIGVGCAGTIFARTRTPAATPPPAHLAGIEDAVMHLMINSPDFSPRVTDTKEGR